MDMNKLVGTHHILFLCLDALRYDAAIDEELKGHTPVLNQYAKWQPYQATGNFTYPAHQAIFSGFFPCPIDAKNHRERRQLFFPQNAGTGRLAPEGAYAFKESNIVKALSNAGYHTCCIGGVSFFDKRSGLGRVMPEYFKKSYWHPSFSPVSKNSAAKQVECAIHYLSEITDEQPVFMYINISAIHYPNYYYLESEASTPIDTSYNKDTLKSHKAALRYVDSQLEPLFKAFKLKGPTFVICLSDHGTCYGEDGCYGHGINHPMVNTIPYMEFLLEKKESS